MKTKFIVVLFLAIGAFGFAQKKITPKPALKAAAKALKSGNMDVAAEALQAAEGQLDAADEKMKAQYYFFKGQVVASTAGESIDKIESAANAYNKTIEIEKAAGGSKYTADATQKLQLLRQSLIENAIKDQNAKNYKAASEKLYLGYTTNKADTTYLYYAAGNAVNDKDYDTALKYYKELKDLGFSGIKKEFVATNKETGKVDAFQSKQVRDISVKTGEYIKPEIKTSDSKKGEIAKNIALIYMSQGKDEEAIAAIEDAKKENPGDSALMQAEADVYYKLGNIAKYKEIMEQIVSNDPENPDLLYNLGVSASRLGDNDQAMGYYKKALELKPDYTAAQINIASIILSGETKIVDEMNGLGTSSKDNKRYDELTKKRSELYKSAVPYLEGALKSNPDNVEAIRTLMNIFYQLDDPKAGEMKDKLKALEGGN
ncbi:tetratricopeptide repeat protein [Aquimarina sp. MAR_2010_214]|uniref:tetratricopeptide repeat protein n=1 Tax=Aquimarina sp. MAR_2010_214 TaxID=1250026 RepID=UPI000C708E6A|nr:tetratricopeptide repeat protein [Aquimarina sp. MAR_2010_214]PKV51672.1 tetratricopeptide repeat protein [Aquimarina sp. MAR_2010_214]